MFAHRNVLEKHIEAHLVKLVEAAGGEVRKVSWPGRRFAPDRFVMLPGGCFWVELKNPRTLLSFPADAHERGQAREHAKMALYGEEVHVLGTLEGVEALVERKSKWQRSRSTI